MQSGSLIFVSSIVTTALVSATCVATVETKNQTPLPQPQETPEFIPASLFWNTIGVRVQWSGRADTDHLSADEERRNISYIGINHHFRALGTHHVRDSAIRNADDMVPDATVGWGAFGHPFDIDSNHCTNTWVTSELARAKGLFNTASKKARFKFYELANEPDMRNQFSKHGENYNPADLPPCMAKFYSQIRSDAWFDDIAILGPSFAFVSGHVAKENGVRIPIPGMSATANLETTSEISNVHVYYHKDNEKPGAAMHHVLHGNRAYIGGSHPVFVTETGRKSNLNQQSQARKIVAALVAAVGNGAARVYQFTPYDWPNGNSWGLMTHPDEIGNFDFKLSAEAIKRLLDLVKTDTCTGTGCSRVLPNFSVTSAANDVLSVPVYNSGTDRYLVFLWRDSGSNAAADSKATDTTVDFGVNVHTCSVHRLTNGSVESASKSGAVVTLGVTNFVSALACRLSGDKPSPSSPDFLDATVSGNVVQLEWAADGDNTDGYTIYRKLDESHDILGYRPIASVSASARSYMDILPALSGAQYRYSIRANNWKGRSEALTATANVSATLDVFEDFLDNASNLKDQSNNWTIDNPQQVHYDRDQGVARRTDDSPAYLVYERPNVHAIQVIYFRKAGADYNTVNLYRKSGRSWAPIAADYDVAPALAERHGTDRVIVTSNEVLPNDTSEIKIEVTGSRPRRGENTGILEAIGRVRLYYSDPS